jgi:hypothetical protein
LVIPERLSPNGSTACQSGFGELLYKLHELDFGLMAAIQCDVFDIIVKGNRCR